MKAFSRAAPSTGVRSLYRGKTRPLMRAFRSLGSRKAKYPRDVAPEFAG